MTSKEPITEKDKDLVSIVITCLLSPEGEGVNCKVHRIKPETPTSEKAEAEMAIPWQTISASETSIKETPNPVAAGGETEKVPAKVE
jgi:hypothetical protein